MIPYFLPRRFAFVTKVTPMITKNIPLYHLRNPSANTNIIAAIKKLKIPKIKDVLCKTTSDTAYKIITHLNNSF